MPRRVWNREDLRTKLVVLGPPLGPNADRRNEVQAGPLHLTLLSAASAMSAVDHASI